MPRITTKDGVEIFYKDWGSGQPIVFSHGWPLSADDWDAQMLFFLNQGFRVIAHDRRGHGRSAQTGGGHDMDHYADDLAALTAHLDLKNAVHVGHSTGGGEVVHYLARHGESRVAKAAIISAVPPLMVKTDANPNGQPKKVFDDFQAALAANRAQFYYDVPAGPFYGYNRPGAKPSQATIWNWWRQGMMGGAKAHYDGIVAFSQTDFTEDLKKITVPVLVMHSEDDQIVPYVASGPLVRQAAEERHPENLQGLPARHAHDRSRNDQRRPAGVHQGLELPVPGPRSRHQDAQSSAKSRVGARLLGHSPDQPRQHPVDPALETPGQRPQDLLQRRLVRNIVQLVRMEAARDEGRGEAGVGGALDVVLERIADPDDLPRRQPGKRFQASVVDRPVRLSHVGDLAPETLV